MRYRILRLGLIVGLSLINLAPAVSWDEPNQSFLLKQQTIALCIADAQLQLDSTILAKLNALNLTANGSPITFLNVKPLLPQAPRHANEPGTKLTKVFTTTFTPALDPREVAALISAQSDVAFACPLYGRHWCHLPNDPLFPQQWALHNEGGSQGRSDADVDAPEAWAISTGAPDVVIAIIDTGIDYTHPDLTQSLWINPGETPLNELDDDGNGFIDDLIGWDFTDNDFNPFDDYGHGTHVSGIVAAQIDNGLGITGLAPRCRLMIVKVGGIYGLFDDDAIQGIIYAVDNGAQILNNSWGSYQYSELIELSMLYAAMSGVTVVAAAGNNNTDAPHYPAALPSVIAVAATDQFDRRSVWSPTSASNYGSWVTLSAPGTAILSTLPNSSYAAMNGTSMACPYVSAAMGLLRARFPEQTSSELYSRLVSTCDPLYPSNFEYVGLGYGRLNAARGLAEQPRPNFRIHALTVTERRGDGDGHPESGESLGLRFTITNSWRACGEVTLRLEGSDRYTSISNRTTTLTALEAWESRLVDSDVEIVVHEDCPSHNPLRFFLTASATAHAYLTVTPVDLILNNQRPPQQGWPFRVQGSIYGAPTIIPLGPNRHGVVVGDDAGYLYALAPHATLIPGWPTSGLGRILASPAAADLDQDMVTEIVIGSVDGALHCLKTSGSEVSGWPVSTGGHGCPTSVALADLTADSVLEVIDATWTGFVYALDYTGHILPGWPVKTVEGVNSCPAIGDLDRDGYLDVVIADKAGYVYALNRWGEQLTPWPLKCGAGFIAAPVIADLEPDGDLEIIVADMQGLLGVLHHDGQWAHNWPVALDNRFAASPAVTDLDGDQDQEIVVCDARGCLHIYEHTGKSRSGWPVLLGAPTESSPVIADLDGHPGPEIGLAAEFKLHLLSLAGKPIPGYPLTLGGIIKGTPCIADLDGDEDLELICPVQNRTLTVIDTPGQAINFQPTWPEYQGSATRTGRQPEVTGQPAIRLAGVWPVSDHGDNYLAIVAWVVDGNRDIARVTASIPGFPIIPLTGTDSLYSARIPEIEAGSTTRISIQAVDYEGIASDPWPLLSCGQESSDHQASQTHQNRLEPEDAEDGPAILLAGYNLSRVTGEHGGAVQIIAYPVSPLAAPIAAVEIVSDGRSIGQLLHDDGVHGDFAAHDGFFGLALMIPPEALQPGRYQVELRAWDEQGRAGPVWPEVPCTAPGLWYEAVTTKKESR